MYVLMKIRISQHHHHMTLDDRTHHAFQHLMMITSHSCEHAAVVERGWFCINSTTPFPKSEEQGKLRPTKHIQKRWVCTSFKIFYSYPPNSGVELF